MTFYSFLTNILIIKGHLL